MRKKRGVSPLIATVLLVGFAVALAAIVSTFVIKETKKFNPESFLEDSPFCENIVIEAVGNIKANTGDMTTIPIGIKSVGGGFYELQGIGIKNKGSFNVKAFSVKSGGTNPTPIIPGKEDPADDTSLYEGRPGGVTIVRKKSDQSVIGIPFVKNDEQTIVIQASVRDPEKDKVFPCPKQEIRVNYKEICCHAKECQADPGPPAELGISCSP